MPQETLAPNRTTQSDYGTLSDSTRRCPLLWSSKDLQTVGTHRTTQSDYGTHFGLKTRRCPLLWSLQEDLQTVWQPTATLSGAAVDWLKGTRGGAKESSSWITSSISAPHFSSWTSPPTQCFTYTVYLKRRTSSETNYSDLIGSELQPGPAHSQPRPSTCPNYYSSTFLQEQAYILLDCGEDNLCIPDLQLSASMDRRELVICDENLVMLTITVLNQGEGRTRRSSTQHLPAEADYIGVERRVEGLSPADCESGSHGLDAGCLSARERGCAVVLGRAACAGVRVGVGAGVTGIHELMQNIHAWPCIPKPRPTEFNTATLNRFHGLDCFLVLVTQVITPDPQLWQHGGPKF
ncbi:unnamed protein product [Boreogadus saida]